MALSLGSSGRDSPLRGGKPLHVKTRSVARTMVTGTQVATLPRGSRIIALVLSGTASNAGTTATLSVGSTAANSNEFVNAVNVLSGGSGNGVNVLNGVAGALGGLPAGGAPNTTDLPIFVKYAETGGASSAGAWFLHIVYTTGNITNDDSQ
jgi:hypothetical protein